MSYSSPVRPTFWLDIRSNSSESGLHVHWRLAVNVNDLGESFDELKPYFQAGEFVDGLPVVEFYYDIQMSAGTLKEEFKRFESAFNNWQKQPANTAGLMQHDAINPRIFHVPDISLILESRSNCDFPHRLQRIICSYIKTRLGAGVQLFAAFTLSGVLDYLPFDAFFVDRIPIGLRSVVVQPLRVNAKIQDRHRKGKLKISDPVKVTDFAPGEGGNRLAEAHFGTCAKLTGQNSSAPVHYNSRSDAFPLTVGTLLYVCAHGIVPGRRVSLRHGDLDLDEFVEEVKWDHSENDKLLLFFSCYSVKFINSKAHEALISKINKFLSEAIVVHFEINRHYSAYLADRLLAVLLRDQSVPIGEAFRIARTELFDSFGYFHGFVFSVLGTGLPKVSI